VNSADLLREARRVTYRGIPYDGWRELVVQLTEAFESYHAKLREWAIQPWPRAMTLGKWWTCRMCGAGWEGSIERHKSDCLATPMATVIADAEAQGRAT